MQVTEWRMGETRVSLPLSVCLGLCHRDMVSSSFCEATWLCLPLSYWPGAGCSIFCSYQSLGCLTIPYSSFLSFNHLSNQFPTFNSIYCFPSYSMTSSSQLICNGYVSYERTMLASPTSSIFCASHSVHSRQWASFSGRIPLFPSNSPMPRATFSPMSNAALHLVSTALSFRS